jgi:hypothetical protein
MSGEVKAPVSAGRPVVRIYGFSDPGSSEEYAELQFATQEEANGAATRLNKILQQATGLVFGRSQRGWSAAERGDE